jgi:hypothetical protein
MATTSGRQHALLMGVEVLILSTHFFVGKAVTPCPPRIVTVLVLLLVGIVRVHYLYLNPSKYQIFSTKIL